ncbi:MAG: hypothetical protein NTW26_06865 [bacterium]|nr:hypothetical protein [bacterium]
MAGKGGAGWIMAVIGAGVGVAGFFVPMAQVVLWITGGALIAGGLLMVWVLGKVAVATKDLPPMPTMRESINRMDAGALFLRQQTRLDMLKSGGRPARVKILDFKPAGIQFNNDPFYIFDLAVMPEGLPSYGVREYLQCVSPVMLPRIKAGGTYHAWVDSEDSTRLIITWAD